ncbi:hypothetical protein SDC9_200355 [bioreactor metagenome]|uniref:Uncharacterized protein n=1 Tax=bioreactor metagenome TaxID=1076179 RepID=A0A645IZR5_9ZZZZ
MRGGDVPGDRIDDFLVLIKNDIQNEIHAYHTCGFFKVFTNGIAFQLSRHGGGVNHKTVVGLNCRTRAHAGHDGLCTAGIAREIVVFDIAETNSPVGLRNRTHNFYGCSAFGKAVMDVIVNVPIDACDLLIHACAGEFFPFRGRMLSVAAEREHERYAILRDAGGV